MNVVSIDKACELAGVSRRTIYNWIRDDRIKWIRTAGGQRRILIDSLFKPGNIKPRIAPGTGR